MRRSVTWSMVVETLTRPYRVTPLMILFVSLIPLYIFIPTLLDGRRLYVPELALDRALSVEPHWVLLYGPLYLFLIVLPVLVVRQGEHIRRTVQAYLFVWVIAYVFFLAYPTSAPRPPALTGEGFAVWGLTFLYSADPPYNCFPSLHVAHSCVSALTCFRMHRLVGIAAMVSALLVGLSTVFTKQHYVLDVVAGILLACVAYLMFLRSYPRESIPELDRRLVPVIALGLLACIGLVLVGMWLVYRLTLAH